MDRFLNVFRGDGFNLLTEDDEGSLGRYFELSLRQRFYGFLGSAGIGLVTVILGLIMLFFMKLVSFSVLYSIGNLCLVTSLMFIVGPMRQLRSMMSEYRYLTSIVFILSIIGTLVMALVVSNVILTIVFVVIQTCAFVWYVLSYIPFGRTLCWSCLRNTSEMIV